MAYDTLNKRDWKIYFEWIEGKEYKQLSEEFKLAESTIKDICHKLLPLKVKGHPYLSKDAYKPFREWKRKQDLNNRK